MTKINYCYHSHTYRCGHAEGTDEDYIKAAIKFGLKNYGVSDHVILPGYSQPGMRGAGYELDGYLSSIRSLAKKYAKHLNVYVGFECEYMPEFLDYYRDLLATHKVDYLILGQHMYLEDMSVRWYMDYDSETAVKKYTEHLILGMKTGLFKYVAHPDLFMCFSHHWGEVEKACAKKIIETAVQCKMPLEINLCHARIYGKRMIAGYYSYYQYPFTPFWEMVAQSKAKVVVGFDAHLPDDVAKPGIEILDDVIKETGVKVDFDYKII